MPTSFKGATSSSGQTGSQSGPKNHAALQLGQISPEQSISVQIRKLTVRLFVDMYEPWSDKYLVIQEFRREVPRAAGGVVLTLFPANPHLTGRQGQTLTKAKIETVLKRLERLSLGKNKEDEVVDDNESKRRTRLSELVSSAKRGLILISTNFQLSQEGRGKITPPIRPTHRHSSHGY